MTSTIASDVIINEDLPTRWEIELEFVQSLANTQYLTYLAQSGYLNDPNFLNYLNYLNYWKDPNYSKHLVYPNCLHILTLLQNENFRRDILNVEVSNLIYKDMVDIWKEPLFKEEKERERKSSPKKIDKPTNGNQNNINSDNNNHNDDIEIEIDRVKANKNDNKERKEGLCKEEREIDNIKEEKMDIDS